MADPVVSYRVDQSSDVPPSRQLAEAVMDAISSRTLGAGARLPSVRAMAAEALVNPNTVAKAYRDLEAFGVVEGRNGLGVFVCRSGPRIARARRGQATLEAFERAAAAALRAGHGITDLRRVLSGRERKRA